MNKLKEEAARLRAMHAMQERGQFAVAALVRETDSGLVAPDEGDGPLLLQSLVSPHYLRRMTGGQREHCTQMLTSSDLCDALVAAFELGDVQLRLILPLLGRELRSGLLSLPPGQPLLLKMTADDFEREGRLRVNLGPGSAARLASEVRDDDGDTASTLGALIELAQDVACLDVAQPCGRVWPGMSSDTLLVTVLPASLVRATAMLMHRGQQTTH